jgi:transaldolase
MSDAITLLKHGQSLWLDYIDRDLLVNGGLRRLVETGIRGVTSNPTIFHKAITSGEDYDAEICDLIQADHGINEFGLYQWLTIQDVQMAADILKSVYDSSSGSDGFVSLEVSPHLAHDTDGTIESARQLWREVNRPNLMIKVPGTKEGLPAIEQLIGEGINVNVTLLFSVARYKEVIRAYLRGLEKNTAPASVASVASFFISRVDTKADNALDQLNTPDAQELKGTIAIANAKMAYQCFLESQNTPEFKAQQQRGAKMQRPLWASTSTKNPAYSDLLYLEELIGPNTVNTVPPNTLDAFLHHGEIRDSITDALDIAKYNLDRLAKIGISLDEITQQLEDEGVAAFAQSYDQLIAALKEKCVTVAENYASV